MSAMKPIYLIFAEENHGGWVEASKLQYDKTCEDDRWMLHSDCEDWLTTHDAKVRDDALEEAAKRIDECGTYYAFDSNGDIIGYAEEFIRLMKGKS